MTTAERIYQESAKLPESMRNEVLAYIEGLKKQLTKSSVTAEKQENDLNSNYFQPSVSVSEEEHQAILVGFDDVKAGRVIPHSAVRATYEQRL